ncbi:hypothetical protein N7532_003831 [Penicillium argentinense]|uniref:Fork-head domain-containing protein n=1 Tax=Penicillium argentinense TaxID=1131581 RepID=A0A9W9FN89_9EURO|nr:uncharacterized protein N7532_003831 [Penicillium argentinense]KAJ5103302.1 hypothetical protein N7532_003831 [Penicillium argentinense]
MAQIPTDQREHEQHPSVQKRTQFSSGSEAILNTNLSGPQPYYPGSQVEKWPAYTQAPAPGSMIPPQQPGYSNPWGATVFETYDPTASRLPRYPGPENAYFSSFRPAHPSHQNPMIATPSNMNPNLNARSYRHPDQDNTLDWNTQPVSSSSFFVPDSYWLHPGHLEATESKIQAISMRATPSPPLSVSPHQSPSQSLDSTSPAPTTTTNAMGDGNSPPTSLGDHSEEEHTADPPYSALIYEALKDAEDRKLTLKEIYQWFEEHTNKSRDPSSKGWQNSIRHNLSMNQGFEAIKGESIHGKKPNNFWRLTDEAFENGIQSTTRYRRATNKGKMTIPDSAIRDRRRSESKGGWPMKQVAKTRLNAQEDQRREQYVDRKPTLRPQDPSTQPHQQPHQQPMRSPFMPSPKIFGISSFDRSSEPASSALPRSSTSQFYEAIGCTSPPPGSNGVFCVAPGWTVDELNDWQRPMSS